MSPLQRMILVVVLAMITAFLFCSCGQRAEAPQPQLDGTLNLEQIIEHAESGQFLGLTLDELSHLCGTNEQQHPDAEHDYQKFLSVGCGNYDDWGISVRYLLARTAEGRVVEAKIHCD